VSRPRLTRGSAAISSSLRWPDDAGPWEITAHWGQVNGRPVIVGLDVHSYAGQIMRVDGSMEWRPVGDQLAEVTQGVLRGISITKIRDDTREALIRNSEALLAVLPPEMELHAEWAADRLSTLTAKGERRKRRPAAGEDTLRLVAALYTEAIGRGDKAPAKYVEDQLRERGEPRLSTKGGRVLVRQWIRRARERGYLPPNGGSK
jgi:hypothetical protein